MKKKPRLYLDVQVGGNQAARRVVLEMYPDVVDSVEGFLGQCKLAQIEPSEYLYFGTISRQSVRRDPKQVVRKHACAGVVSLARGSQLSITLGQVSRFDGKQLVVGQVVAGMEVLRDLQQIPRDSSNRPRVTVSVEVLVDASEGRSEIFPTISEEKIPPPENFSGNFEADPSSSSLTSALPPNMSQRLLALQLKMNQAKQLNNVAVLNEKKRLADPKAYMRSLNKEVEETDEQKEEKGLLLETAEAASRRIAKRGTDESSFAWDMFNEDSQYKAHDKRLDQMGFYPDAYEKQKLALGPEAFYSASANLGTKPSEEAKQRLVDSAKLAGQKRKEFSRRRTNNDDDDVLWVNERNKNFTKKIERAFGQHTAEIKANLERGTAL